MKSARSFEHNTSGEDVPSEKKPDAVARNFKVYSGRVRDALNPATREHEKSVNDLQTEAHILRADLEKLQDDRALEAYHEVQHLNGLLREERDAYDEARRAYDAAAAQKNSFAKFLSKNFGELSVAEQKIFELAAVVKNTEGHLADAQKRAEKVGLVFARMERIQMRLQLIEHELERRAENSSAAAPPRRAA